MGEQIDLIECGLWAFYMLMWFFLLTGNFGLFVNWLQIGFSCASLF